ncbi:hypothetical protein [Halobacillus trueperi]|uniref:Uncharacterized protein n=1 Tax=Halobacillus trueperi TaxID=156205 RepID=A0A3E0JC27_9BACI|nr:hypothetical protein [Halobacillus trueperi]REJ10344.1 hypothetical protein DYE48_06495 [Halobacillus trueperi]
MNSVTMAESLLVMDHDSLKFNYALIHNTSIMKILIPFAKDQWNRNTGSEVMDMIGRETRRYRYTPHILLQKMLLDELLGLYKIPINKTYTKQDVVDQCDRIIRAMYEEMKRNNKKFAHFINGKDPRRIELIMEYQMHRLIESISDKKISDFQLHQIGDALEEFIGSLPQQKQKQIAHELGIFQVTSSTIRQLILSNGTTVVFAAIVQVSGFAFYTTLTTVLASVFGLIGITLPFAAYATLTSTVAIIANPFVFLPALLIGGGGLLKWQNNKMKKAMAPVVFMHIMLGANPLLEPDWEAFINA